MCAVVVTYNRPEKLAKTLQLLLGQTYSLQKIIVIDNASDERTKDLLSHFKSRSEIVEVHYLLENRGGSGGFHEGMRLAMESGEDWVWIMDDDAYPTPDCLYKLVMASADAPVRVAVQVDQLGQKYGIYRWDNAVKALPVDDNQLYQPIDLFAFVGPCFRREVVVAVGLPRADFFICADDWEYSLRIKGKGFSAVAVTNAIIHHNYGETSRVVERFSRKSVRDGQPAWKQYYAARNEIEILRSSNSDSLVKAKYARNLLVKWLRITIGEIVFEANLSKIKYRMKGIFDGLIGKMGKIK
ncbi:glycosyltransferase [Deinococcus metallilatus]|uniref:GT2 family glycosyltransferase n=1 Tax=Deinococcus metallilatus TaxID=1211322 RepID=A0ABR6N0L7_9DEIO|nr:glycosyltransferase [Deinococcus metallilatus]MBB5297041.1 GT2 family glycosyltransferase [Deinococcus metallilatus]